MASTVIPNVWTLANFAGGVTAIAGRGPTYSVTVDGMWNVGDTFTFQIVLPAQTYDFGIGRVTGVVPTSAITLYARVHFVAGNYWYGSDNNNATAWEQQAPGAFKINISNQSQQPEPLLALAPFQGRIALFSRRTTQVWIINADPTQITQQQVLSNIGIVAPDAARSLGDLDIPFPSDSGIRSLRVQTINLNGYISDIGSPIDYLIQSAVAGETDSELTGICSVIEPTANRFMIYFPSTELVYVLSYFPSSKIIAWSTYTCQFNDGVPSDLITFQIQSFRVYNSIVFFRAVTTNGTVLPDGSTNFIGSYGTPDGSLDFAYDATPCEVTTPWLDLKKSELAKTAQTVDYAIVGQWSIYGSMDYQGVANKGAALQPIIQKANPPQSGQSSTQLEGSFQWGTQDWTDEGYHIQFQAIRDDVTYPSAYSKLSEIVFGYEINDPKA